MAQTLREKPHFYDQHALVPLGKMGNYFNSPGRQGRVRFLDSIKNRGQSQRKIKNGVEDLEMEPSRTDSPDQSS